jgi:hypothetical protein
MKQIETVHLFPKLTNELLNLLQDLDESDWLKATPIPGRTVKDLVSHMIDGALRKMSIHRDGFADQSNIPNIKSYQDLVDYIQKLNSDWMTITRRLSPAILLDLLEYAQNEFNSFIQTLDPDDQAIFPVNWAGETESKNWFDTAREFTEVWHHQMQIRLALDKPLLMDIQYLDPLYDTFMRGLPYLYKDFTNYEENYTIKVTITGTQDLSWRLKKQPESWILVEEQTDFNTALELPGDIAWKIFTNTDREKEKFKSNLIIHGDQSIGMRILDFVTVMS